MNVKREGWNRVYFEYRYRGAQVRRWTTVEALTAFLCGNLDEASNLDPDAQPLPLGQFLTEQYLPLCARPRIGNERTYIAEADIVRVLALELGSRPLHTITSKDAEFCRKKWLRESYSNSMVKKRLNGLRRVMDYGVRVGLIKMNPVPPVKGLRIGNRSGIWLRLTDIERLLECCHPTIRPLCLYMILTGARILEALDQRDGDVRGGKLYVPTEKRKRPCREVMREFDIPSLGPRFARLLLELKPNPRTGFYFYANDRSSRALSYSYFNRLFTQAKKKAGLDHIKPHDLRGTFCVHRAMVVKSFRQLQVEMGHGDARSIQSYLDSAQSYDRRESIFHSQASGFTEVMGAVKNESGKVIMVGEIRTPKENASKDVHQTAHFELTEVGLDN